MSTHKYQQVAAIVREQITDGTLAPGAPAPSGAALSRATGYSALTCRRALRALITARVLLPGASRDARPRVPGANHDDRTLAEAKRALSAALAEHRHAAGLTQPQLAELIGLSVTTIGHAETGRTWQSPLLGTRRQSAQRQRRTPPPARHLPRRGSPRRPHHRSRRHHA